MVYSTDYHIHTDYSDGKARPEEYIEKAKIIGLKEIGFSEHLNLFYNDPACCIDTEKVPEYLNHISFLSQSRNEIIIKTGLEVDFFPGKKKEIYDFIAPLELDYVIGAVHYIGAATIDSSEEFYKGKKIDCLFSEYFEIVCEAIASGLFNFIAHCDLIRIFGYRYSGNPEHFYRHLAEMMAKHDVAFEINTNGKNKPFGEFYPDIRYLHYFRKAKVPVCVNSDAHFPARVGEYFPEAYKLLKDAGYTEMCTFRKRDRFLVSSDFRISATK